MFSICVRHLIPVVIQSIEPGKNLMKVCFIRDGVQSFSDIRYLEFIQDRFTSLPLLAILNPIFTIRNTHLTFFSRGN